MFGYSLRFILIVMSLTGNLVPRARASADVDEFSSLQCRAALLGLDRWYATPEDGAALSKIFQRDVPTYKTVLTFLDATHTFERQGSWGHSQRTEVLKTFLRYLASRGPDAVPSQELREWMIMAVAWPDHALQELSTIIIRSTGDPGPASLDRAIAVAVPVRIAESLAMARARSNTFVPLRNVVVSGIPGTATPQVAASPSEPLPVESLSAFEPPLPEQQPIDTSTTDATTAPEWMRASEPAVLNLDGGLSGFKLTDSAKKVLQEFRYMHVFPTGPRANQHLRMIVEIAADVKSSAVLRAVLGQRPIAENYRGFSEIAQSYFTDGFRNMDGTPVQGLPFRAEIDAVSIGIWGVGASDFLPKFWNSHLSYDDGKFTFMRLAPASGGSQTWIDSANHFWIHYDPVARLEKALLSYAHTQHESHLEFNSLMRLALQLVWELRQGLRPWAYHTDQMRADWSIPDYIAIAPSDTAFPPIAERHYRIVDGRYGNSPGGSQGALDPNIRRFDVPIGFFKTHRWLAQNHPEIAREVFQRVSQSADVSPHLQNAMGTLINREDFVPMTDPEFNALALEFGNDPILRIPFTFTERSGWLRMAKNDSEEYVISSDFSEFKHIVDLARPKWGQSTQQFRKTRWQLYQAAFLLYWDLRTGAVPRIGEGKPINDSNFASTLAQPSAAASSSQPLPAPPGLDWLETASASTRSITFDELFRATLIRVAFGSFDLTEIGLLGDTVTIRSADGSLEFALHRDDYDAIVDLLIQGDHHEARTRFFQIVAGVRAQRAVENRKLDAKRHEENLQLETKLKADREELARLQAIQEKEARRVHAILNFAPKAYVNLGEFIARLAQISRGNAWAANILAINFIAGLHTQIDGISGIGKTQVARLFADGIVLNERDMPRLGNPTLRLNANGHTTSYHYASLHTGSTKSELVGPYDMKLLQEGGGQVIMPEKHAFGSMNLVLDETDKPDPEGLAALLPGLDSGVVPTGDGEFDSPLQAGTLLSNTSLAEQVGRTYQERMSARGRTASALASRIATIAAMLPSGTREDLAAAFGNTAAVYQKQNEGQSPEVDFRDVGTLMDLAELVNIPGRLTDLMADIATALNPTMAKMVAKDVLRHAREESEWNESRRTIPEPLPPLNHVRPILPRPAKNIGEALKAVTALRWSRQMSENSTYGREEKTRELAVMDLPKLPDATIADLMVVLETHFVDAGPPSDIQPDVFAPSLQEISGKNRLAESKEAYEWMHQVVVQARQIEASRYALYKAVEAAMRANGLQQTPEYKRVADYLAKRVNIY